MVRTVWRQVGGRGGLAMRGDAWAQPQIISSSACLCLLATMDKMPAAMHVFSVGQKRHKEELQCIVDSSEAVCALPYGL